MSARPAVGRLWRRLAGAAAILALAGAAATAVADDGPVAGTTEGRVRGTADGAVNVFRGVPYARPPVGALRWRPPETPARWNGVRDATQYGAACMQPVSPFYDHPAVSEDCLFLNVWAPAGAREAPVIVWIHGGSLVSGAGSEPIFDGARFARQGVVVVTINYRLGPLGWLAHPGLSAESPDGVSGNYGLMDQIEALRWVQRNIRAFGGDPDAVTVAGESAGGLSVLYLMASPEARGLFRRAIAQSAYLITMPELRDGTYADWPDAETIGLSLATQLGATDLAALREMSAQSIVEGTARTRYFPLGAIDGRWLPRQLVEVFDRGEQAPTPILAGFNEGEIRSLRILLPPAPADGEAYASEIRARYGDLAETFLERYPPEALAESMMATTRDAMYGWTAERVAASQTALGAPSYLYLFDHGYPAADAKGLHAFHGSEIPFVFGTTARTPAYWPAVPQNGTERRLSDAMLAYWASFARDGVPQAPGEAVWRPYGGERAYMAFEDAPRLRFDPPNAFALHEEVVCRRRAAGGLAWHWNVGVIAPPTPPPAPRCAGAATR